MKKDAFVVLLLFLTLSVSAYQTRDFTMNFSKDDFSMNMVDGVLSISSEKYTYSYSNDNHSPALPYICLNILISPQESYSGFEFQETEMEIEDNIEIAPNPVFVSTNYSGAYFPQRRMEYQHSLYPETKIEYTGTHDLGGFRYMGFRVCPFKFDAVRKQLYLSSEIKLSVKLSHDFKNTDSNQTLSSKCLIQDIESLVINGYDIDTLYPNIRKANRDIPSLTLEDAPVKYLIVTCDSLKNEFLKLANWKTIKGFKSEVITVEHIDSFYTGRNQALRIKKALRDHYYLSNAELEFVLLGGGVSIVPVQDCYSRITNYEGTQIGNSPSDIFYSCLSVMDWDKHHTNGLYGEIEDSVDLLQSFAISRLPVGTSLEARNVVSKIIEYERNPDISGWKNEFLMCGVKTKFYSMDSNGNLISDSQISSEAMYSQYVPTGWNGSKYRFYDTCTDNSNGSNYDVTKDNLQFELSKGYAFVNVNTHGNILNWSMEDSISPYSFSKAQTLVSPRYSIVFTQACHTNNINYPISLGSCFVNNPDCGVLAYYGSSNLGIGALGGGIGPGEIYSGEVITSILSNQHQLGKAIRTSKNNHVTAGNINTYNSERWNILYMLHLGDPEMPVYDTIPQRFNYLSMSHFNNHFSFSFGYNSYQVCAMSRHDNGSSYYETRSGYGVMTFSPSTDESLVCLTSQNHIPYRTIFGSSVKLQNETLSDCLNVTAETTIIGSNVDSNREQGPVIVKNGDSVISSRYGTTIYNDFEVKLGASLEINTNYNDTYYQ